MRYLFILLVVFVAGCCTDPPPSQVVYQKVEVPGPVVYCKIKRVEKPVDLVASLKTTDDIYYKTQILLADHELKEGYLIKLETAIISCNQSN